MSYAFQHIILRAIYRLYLEYVETAKIERYDNILLLCLFCQLLGHFQAMRYEKTFDVNYLHIVESQIDLLEVFQRVCISRAEVRDETAGRTVYEGNA